VNTSPGGERRHRPRLFSNRMTPIAAGCAFLLLILGPLALVTANGLLAILPLVGYLLLVLVTWAVVAGVRREPGTWLGRRAVRRCLVAAIAADCVGLVANSPPGSQLGSATPPLLIFLVLLNIALGNATQRMATAPQGWIDERQEELRNHAHRLAYPVFAAVVGAFLLADIASTPSREWAEHALGSGGFFVFLELLFVLPAMVLAFIEPAPPPPESDLPARLRRVNVQARFAVALVALVFALPLLGSAAVVLLPLRTSSHVSSPPQPGPVLSGTPASPSPPTPQVIPLTCHAFNAEVEAGWGVYAGLPVSAEACGNGQRATEEYGMNQGDCMMGGGLLVAVTTEQCTRTVSADGTLTFTWRVALSPDLIPFLSRQVTVQVVIDKNGNVERFP
jgi:hypothetical protein